MILPVTGNSQVSRRYADLREPVALEHALRCGVVQQGAGLNPVQAQFPEGHRDRLTNGCGRESAPVVLLADPVTEAG